MTAISFTDHYVCGYFLHLLSGSTVLPWPSLRRAVLHLRGKKIKNIGGKLEREMASFND